MVSVNDSKAFCRYCRRAFPTYALDVAQTCSECRAGITTYTPAPRLPPRPKPGEKASYSVFNLQSYSIDLSNDLQRNRLITNQTRATTEALTRRRIENRRIAGAISRHGLSIDGIEAIANELRMPNLGQARIKEVLDNNAIPQARAVDREAVDMLREYVAPNKKTKAVWGRDASGKLTLKRFRPHVQPSYRESITTEEPPDQPSESEQSTEHSSNEEPIRATDIPTVRTHGVQPESQSEDRTTEQDKEEYEEWLREQNEQQSTPVEENDLSRPPQPNANIADMVQDTVNEYNRIHELRLIQLKKEREQNGDI